MSKYVIYWRRGLHEKLLVAQLVRKLSALYETSSCVTMLMFAEMKRIR
jgi:hypothetical protein